jgi:hypothetical protein
MCQQAQRIECLTAPSARPWPPQGRSLSLDAPARAKRTLAKGSVKQNLIDRFKKARWAKAGEPIIIGNPIDSEQFVAPYTLSVFAATSDRTPPETAVHLLESLTRAEGPDEYLSGQW